MPSDDITLALAVWGAVTGSASAAAAVYTQLRDRPRLKLAGQVQKSMDAESVLAVEISNSGRRPTTVREVGFFEDFAEFSFRKPGADEPFASSRGEVGCVVARSIFLEAGQTKTFDATTPVFALGRHVDEPLRLYAKDINGRRIWGDASPALRILVGMNPRLESLVPEARQRVVPTGETRLPAKVEASWKFWKRRELRQPTAWRNPAPPPMGGPGSGAENRNT